MSMPHSLPEVRGHIDRHYARPLTVGRLARLAAVCRPSISSVRSALRLAKRPTNTCARDESRVPENCSSRRRCR